MPEPKASKNIDKVLTQKAIDKKSGNKTPQILMEIENDTAKSRLNLRFFYTRKISKKQCIEDCKSFLNHIANQFDFSVSSISERYLDIDEIKIEELNVLNNEYTKEMQELIALTSDKHEDTSIPIIFGDYKEYVIQEKKNENNESNEKNNKKKCSEDKGGCCLSITTNGLFNQALIVINTKFNSSFKFGNPTLLHELLHASGLNHSNGNNDEFIGNIMFFKGGPTVFKEQIDQLMKSYFAS